MNWAAQLTSPFTCENGARVIEVVSDSDSDWERGTSHIWFVRNTSSCSCFDVRSVSRAFIKIGRLFLRQYLYYLFCHKILNATLILHLLHRSTIKCLCTVKCAVKQ